MPRSHAAVSRRKAVKLIAKFVAAHGELFKVSTKLAELRPYGREAFFSQLVSSPQLAVHWASVWLRFSDIPLDRFESTVLHFPDGATYGAVLPFLQEYIASRGWTE